MSWIAEHIQVVVAIAGGIAWWLNKVREKPDDAPARPRAEKAFDDPELAERTRRIRDEIQRKIEQRAKGYATERPTLPREPASPPPLIRTVPEPPPVPVAPRRSLRSSSRQEAERAAEILEEQATMMEQVRLADEMRAAALRRVKFEAEIADQETAAVAAMDTGVRDDLRDPAALRRAFILREVIGPPVALRS